MLLCSRWLVCQIPVNGPFLLNQKIWHKFWWIISTRWGSSRVTGSKTLWLLNTILKPATYNMTNMYSHLQQQFTCALYDCFTLFGPDSTLCRSFGRILLWWQWREDRKWLVYDEYLIIVFSSFCIFSKMYLTYLTARSLPIIQLLTPNMLQGKYYFLLA